MEEGGRAHADLQFLGEVAEPSVGSVPCAPFLDETPYLQKVIAST